MAARAWQVWVVPLMAAANCPESCFGKRRHHGSFRPATGPSNLVHIFVVQINQIAERANVPHCASLERSIAVDVALHFERPLFAVLAPPERLGHITGLAAD